MRIGKGMVIAVLIFVLFLAACEGKKSDFMHKLLQQELYRLVLIDEGIPVLFEFDPAWLDIQAGEEKLLRLPVGQLHGTEVILDRVGRTEQHLYVTLAAYPDDHAKEEAGEILYVNRILTDGSRVSSLLPENWRIYDKEGQEVPHHGELRVQYGAGPGNTASLFIIGAGLPRIASIEYAGWFLYEYERISK